MKTDPWLKKKKEKSKKNKNVKKKKKSKKKKKKKDSDSDSDDENVDEMFDRALAAAGLMKSSVVNKQPQKGKLNGSNHDQGIGTDKTNSINHTPS